MLQRREEEENSIVNTRGQFCRVKRLVEGQKYPFLKQRAAHFSAFFLPWVRICHVATAFVLTLNTLLPLGAGPDVG